MPKSQIDIAKGFLSRMDVVGSKKATQELAALIIEQRIAGDTEQIILDITREYSRQSGVVDADVQTAFPLSESLKKELSERVKTSTGAKQVILHEEVDTSLLGGVVLSAPGMELDLSLKTKLARLRA